MNSIRSTGQLLEYSQFRKYSHTLIETGAGRGGGIQRALAAGFTYIVSIEALEENYLFCKERFRSNPHVTVLLSQSVELLPRLVALALTRVVFYLDAHPSGPQSYGHQELMEGNMRFAQDTVIRQELGIILESPHRHVIILDDINGDPIASDYAGMISARHPGYQFSFYDENLGTFYKDKLLVAVPEGE